jgi:metal-responsive CopG/Arc/MetJ family transcriptional regulator
MKYKLSITLDDEVFNHIESLRGTRTQFRSEYINYALREKIGLEKTEPGGAPTST